LGAGVLLACSAASFDESGTWLAYHVLMATWTLTAVGTLALGWLSSHGRGEDEPTWPVRLLQGWVALLVLVAVALALPGVGQDPTRPPRSARVILASSAVAGGMAVWSRHQVFVYTSGLLVNLAGTLLSGAWGSPLELIGINVLCLSLASALWSANELILRRAWSLDLRGGWLPF